jgi:hypothetical protein
LQVGKELENITSVDKKIMIKMLKADMADSILSFLGSYGVCLAGLDCQPTRVLQDQC